MPDHSPDLPCVDMAGRCITANTVGGDFFSYLTNLGQEQCGLVIADVSGKAMRGAMNAVLVDGVLSMAVQHQTHLSPGLLLSELNNVLTTRMADDMNVTMVVALIDLHSMHLTLASAAHHAYPLLLRDEELHPLKARGLPLGMRSGITFHEERFDLLPHDVLVFMTDGVIEALNPHGCLYGTSVDLDRTIGLLTPALPAATMVDRILTGTMEFSGSTREDDMTVVVAKIL